MAESKKNDWFVGPNTSFSDVAAMLVEMDAKGLIPADMREAIEAHTRNCVSTLPLGIAAAASALASACAGNFGMDDDQVAKAAWAIASQAEQMHGWNELNRWMSQHPAQENGEVTRAQ